MFKTSKKIQKESLKRSIKVAESSCYAVSAADYVAAQAVPVQSVQSHEDRSLQIEFERKRALGTMYSRNTFG